MLQTNSSARQTGVLQTVLDTVTNFITKHRDAEGSLARAENALRAAQAKYESSLDLGRDAAKSARSTRDDAELDLDIARREVDVWSSRLEAAREEARSAEIRGALNEAERKRKLFEAAVKQHLPAMGVSARALVRAWAEAEIAIETARQVAGPGGSDIPSAENFRASPRVERKEIGRKTIQRWIHPRTREPLHDEIEREAISQGKTAFLRGSSGNTPTQLTERVELERITYEKARSSIEVPLLIQGLSIPPIVAGGVAGWTPFAEHEQRPELVLQMLDSLEHSSSARAAEVETVTEDVFIRNIV